MKKLVTLIDTKEKTKEQIKQEIYKQLRDKEILPPQKTSSGNKK
ncbi:MAG: hypothetical protein WC735_04780 [Candidatus Paceibacterota bacterium]|jgi:hypothetical protein